MTPATSISEPIQRFKAFLRLSERQTGCKLKSLHEQSQGENICAEFSNFLPTYGITHGLAVVFAPQKKQIRNA